MSDLAPESLHSRHEPITDAFPRLADCEDVTAYAPTPDQHRAFDIDGFVAGLRVLDANQCEELATRVDRLIETAHELEPRLYEVERAWTERPSEVVFHCLGAWMVDSWLHDLIFHPAITVAAARLLDETELRFWHDQVFAKPAHHEGAVPWHQDYSYWQRTAPAAHITAHIALDDCDARNGAVSYLPGSHRFGLFPMADFGGTPEGIRADLPEQLRDVAPVTVTLAAGEAVFHHSHVIHGSGPNRSDRPRRTLAINYMASNTRSMSDEPLLNHTNPVPSGEIIDNEWFPIVARLSP